MANQKTYQFLRKIDFSLLLAAIVEIPRWSVTFTAIHEPIVFGIPLAAIITWAMKAGWENYFENPKENKDVLFFNIIALLISCTIITPVIYLLTEAGTFKVVLPDFILGDVEPFRLVWSFALALGTFFPLILLARVNAGKKKNQNIPAEMEAEEPVSVSQEKEEVKEQELKIKKKKVFSSPESIMEKEEKKRSAWQMIQNNVSKEEIANSFGVTTKTIDNWMKSFKTA